jgi:hypothetical protein
MWQPRSGNPNPTAISQEESDNHPADSSPGNFAILIGLVGEGSSRPVGENDRLNHVGNLKEKCGDLKRLPWVWAGWLGCLAAVRMRSLTESRNLGECRLC